MKYEVGLTIMIRVTVEAATNRAAQMNALSEGKNLCDAADEIHDTSVEREWPSVLVDSNFVNGLNSMVDPCPRAVLPAEGEWGVVDLRD